MSIIKPNGSSIKAALQGAEKQDQFLDQLIRDFRQISPEVGGVIATTFGKAIEMSVRIPGTSDRRDIAMLALLIAGAANTAANILVKTGDVAGTRKHATVRAFEFMLDDALTARAHARLQQVMGSA